MTMVRRLIAPGISLLFGAMLSLNCTLALAEVLVVVSADAPFTRLTSSDLRDIYLGRRTQIANGMMVVPLDQPEGTAARSEFYTHFTGQTPAQIKAHWARQIFTGRGQPPQALANSRAVVERLVSDTKALGYIDPAFLDERLRVVTIE
ncbi:phosphate ABC transporter substrate-binding protein [Halomonas sp. ISL-106]|nr:phosphate ABC transporter substrate-binding protein [Halomonas sp. ISL-106]MBT2796078.1 phosphate ABC transporter substrate-binding protein [Halomonas sp. ISL-104]